MKNCKHFDVCGSEAEVGFNGMCSSCWMDHDLLADKPQPKLEPKLEKAAKPARKRRERGKAT